MGATGLGCFFDDLVLSAIPGYEVHGAGTKDAAERLLAAFDDCFDDAIVAAKGGRFGAAA